MKQQTEPAANASDRQEEDGDPAGTRYTAELRRLRTDVLRRPGDPHAWRVLGRGLRRHGQHAAAAAAYARSVTASLSDASLRTIERMLQDGRHSEARTLLTHRLALADDDVVALRLASDLDGGLGDLAEAERGYRRCIELSPTYAPARHGLSRLLLRQARLRDASDEADRLLALAPNDPNARTLRAAIAATSGDHEDAAGLYQGLVAELPQRPALWLGLGHSHRTSGRTRDAVSAYRRASRTPGGAPEAFWSLANLKTHPFDDDDVRRMSDLADQAEGRHAAFLQFAIGHAHDARGDEELAFRAFERGNAIKRAMIDHDAVHARLRLERWTASTTPELIAARSGEGAPASAPILIVGLPRTGSTLVEQILGSHSRIESTAELPYMDRIAAQIAKSGRAAEGGKTCLDLEGIDLAALGRAYLAAAGVHRKTDKPFFIDKAPGNFAHVGLVRLMLPNARIIDVRRHPTATMWSIFKQLFAHGHPYAYDLNEIRQWHRGYVAAMDLFDTRMPGSVIRLSYEDLVNDTEKQVRRLLDSIGVGFEAGCLAPHRNGNAVRTPSSEQVRRPISDAAVDDWHRYKRHLEASADADPSTPNSAAGNKKS